MRIVNRSSNQLEDIRKLGKHRQMTKKSKPLLQKKKKFGGLA